MNQEEFDRLTEQSKNTISAKVICDSTTPEGDRLTTMEWTYPRFIHAEIMTHRMLSRNSASSRAIPLKKMIERVETNPVFPIHWGKNEKGMQASEELNAEQKLAAAQDWMFAKDNAVFRARSLEEIGIHKQIGNRLLEPWMWITVVISATDFENLFALRCHPAAEPHFQNLAYKVKEAFDDSNPTKVPWGGWHLPYFGNNGGDENDYKLDKALHAKISAARCARVSYLTQDGKREPEKDAELYNRLVSGVPLHASPLEHVAIALNPFDTSEFCHLPTGFVKRYKEYILDWGNFMPGWLQFRKMHKNECVHERA